MGVLVAPGADELLLDVRNMLNQPNSTNSFWSDEELLTGLNEGIRRFFAEVIQTGGGQFGAQADLDIVSGQELVALPTDFFKVKALYRAVNGGYQILPYSNNLTKGYSTQVSSSSGYMPYYYFRGNNLVLRPTPGFSETAGLRLEYTAFPATMLTGGDSLTSDVSPVFRDLIVMYGVYKAKLKESLVTGTDTTALAKENLGDLALAMREVLNQRSLNPTYVESFNPEEY